MNEYSFLDGLLKSANLIYKKAIDYEFIKAYENLGLFKPLVNNYICKSIIDLFSKIPERFGVNNKKEYFKRINLNELITKHLKNYEGRELIEIN